MTAKLRHGGDRRLALLQGVAPSLRHPVLQPLGAPPDINLVPRTGSVSDTGYPKCGGIWLVHGALRRPLGAPRLTARRPCRGVGDWLPRRRFPASAPRSSHAACASVTPPSHGRACGRIGWIMNREEDRAFAEMFGLILPSGGRQSVSSGSARRSRKRPAARREGKRAGYLTHAASYPQTMKIRAIAPHSPSNRSTPTRPSPLLLRGPRCVSSTPWKSPGHALPATASKPRTSHPS